MLTGVHEILVFLASPSDVTDEREQIRALADRINPRIEPTGFRVRVLGWEQTPPGVGRPQAHINPEVDRCDIFLGILARRWGSPSGEEHDSGFEEEFDRALARARGVGNGADRRSRGALTESAPMLAMYFKRIPEEDAADPGRQLQKVLDFRQKIVEEHLLLFKEWSNADDLIQQVTELLYGHVTRLTTEASERQQERGAVADEAMEPAESLPPSPASTEPIDEARQQMSTVLRDLDAIVCGSSAEGGYDKDRLQLLAHAFGTDHDELGPHLANRLFRRRRDLVLSVGEDDIWSKTLLSDLGRSRGKSDRIIPGCQVIIPGTIDDDWFAQTGKSMCYRRDLAVATGLLLVLRETSFRPAALWDVADEAFDDSLWDALLGTKPDPAIALDYIAAMFVPAVDEPLFDALDGLPLDPDTTTSLNALRAALRMDAPDAEALANLVGASDAKPAIVDLLMRAIGELSVGTLTGLVGSPQRNLHAAAASELARRGAITSDNVASLLARRAAPFDEAMDQGIISAARRDPDILTAVESYIEKMTLARSSSLGVLSHRVRAEVHSREELRAASEAHPWDVKELEALMFADPDGTVDQARRILDEDAQEAREHLRSVGEVAGKDYSALEDFAADDLCAAASRLLARRRDRTLEDAMRIARAIGRAHVLSVPGLLLTLADTVRPEEVVAVTDILGDFEGYWKAKDVAHILRSPLGRALAPRWRESSETVLRDGADLWWVTQPDRQESEAFELLYDDRSAIRLAAVEVLIERLSPERLIELLDAYPSHGRQYWYNVIARIDEHLTFSAGQA